MENDSDITLKKLQKTMQEFQRRYGVPDMFKSHPHCMCRFSLLLFELYEKAVIDITDRLAIPNIQPSKTLPEDRAVWVTAEYTLLFDFSKTPVEILQLKMPKIENAYSPTKSQ